MHLGHFFILILLLMVGTVSASCSDEEIYEYLSDSPNQEYWDGDWGVADEEGLPVKVVRSNGHIRGWIDIIGFRELCVINGTEYVNGSPKDFAIVKRKAWHTPIDGKVVSFETSSATVDDIDGTTAAIQYTTFHWEKKKCNIRRYHQRDMISAFKMCQYTSRRAIGAFNLLLTSWSRTPGRHR